jgi:hypothetical protein
VRSADAGQYLANEGSAADGPSEITHYASPETMKALLAHGLACLSGTKALTLAIPLVGGEAASSVEDGSLPIQPH